MGCVAATSRHPRLILLLLHMLALYSELQSTSIQTNSTRYAYAMGLLLWPAACMLCVLLLPLS